MEKSYSNNLTQSRYGMSARLIIKKFIFSLIFFIPFVAFLYFFLLLLNFSGKPLYINLTAASSLLLILFFIYEISEFNSIYYEVKDSYVIIKSNIINPIDSIIEYERIRKVEIHKDLIDFLLGLRTVVIYTDFPQSNVHRRAKINGLSKIKAEGLKKYINDTKEGWEEKSHTKPNKRS